MTTKIAEQATAIWTSKEFRHKWLTPISERHNRTKQAGHSQAGQSWPASFMGADLTVLSVEDDRVLFEQYLAEHSAATGIPIDTLRKAESDAREKIGHASPSNDRLRALSARTKPPEKYLQGDESCPF